MSTIILPGECSWFYLIELLHNKRRGFGITGRVRTRLAKGYCIPCCEPEQTFSNLYYGKRSQIVALERWLKNEYRSELFTVVDNKCEWINRDSDLDSLEALKTVVEDRIRVLGYNEVFRVKKEHLPFKATDYFKNIKDDPAKFLERM